MPTEIFVIAKNGRRQKLPILYPEAPPASFSSYERKGRIIYLVECAADDSASGIWKLEARKVDEKVDSLVRILRLKQPPKQPPEEIKEIAILSQGEFYELPIILRDGRKAKLIIKHVAGEKLNRDR